MKSVSMTILLLVIGIAIAGGQTKVDLQEIEDFILQSMNENRVVGSAFTIITADDDLLTRGYGNIFKGGINVDVNTRFEIASLTKSFTALAVVQLVLQEKIKIDDPVISYLPEFKTKNKDISDKITISNLLNHSSGFTTVQGNRYQSVYENHPGTLESVISDYKNVKLKFEPGEHYEYSNANYQLLGLVIERVTSQSYEQYITQNIFQVLNMNFSGFMPNENTALPHRYLFGYPTPYVNNRSRTIVAQGGIFSSIGDMQKYLSAILLRDTLLLPKEGYQLIFDDNQPGLDYYGFAGWNRKVLKDDEKEIEVFWHGGTNIGFVSNMFIIPSKTMAFAGFANTSSFFGIKSSFPLCYGPINLMLNISPQMHSPIIGYIMAVLWVIPFAMLFIVVKRLKKLSASKTPLRVTLNTLLYGVLLFLLLKLIPNQLGSNDLKTVMAFEPQIGYLLLAMAILLIIMLTIDYFLLYRRYFPSKQIN